MADELPTAGDADAFGNRDTERRVDSSVGPRAVVDQGRTVGPESVPSERSRSSHDIQTVDLPGDSNVRIGIQTVEPHGTVPIDANDDAVTAQRSTSAKAEPKTEAMTDAVRPADRLGSTTDRFATQDDTPSPASPNLETIDAETPVDLPPLSASDIGMALAGHEFAGYRIQREIARGGMGVVYKATQVALNRTVALKMVLSGAFASEREVLRFRQEAESAAKLDHPGIVPIFEIGYAGGRHFYSMAFVDGGSATSLIENGPCEPRLAVEMVRKIALAVQHAHEAGIVHRDLKPQNVLLDKAGQPKVTDFGLAKSLEGAAELTGSGQILGTPSFMAPEQADRRFGAVGPLADVYALGAILYYLLLGKPPFQGDSVVKILGQLTSEDPPSLRRQNRRIDADLEAVCLRCLEKNPKHRYPSAKALSDDLGRWISGEPIDAPMAWSVVRLFRSRKRRRTMTAASAVLMLVLGVIWITLVDAGYRVPGGPTARQMLDRFELSFYRRVPSLAYLAQRTQGLTSKLREINATNVDDCLGERRQKFDITMVDGWSKMQQINAVLLARADNPGAADECVNLIERAFDNGPPNERFVEGLGWYPFGTQDRPSTEAVAWGVGAIAKAWQMTGALRPDLQDRLRKRLTMLEGVLERIRSRDKSTGEPTGAWNLYVDQIDADNPCPHVTFVMLASLLDMHEAGLAFQSPDFNRDDLLSQALQYAHGKFKDEGWYTVGAHRNEDFNDALTWFVFGELMRAEQMGLTELTPAMQQSLRRHLERAVARDMSFPVSTSFENYTFDDVRGQRVSNKIRSIKYLWYPWLCRTASYGYVRGKRIGAPHEDVVLCRRVLSRMVHDNGDLMLAESRTAYAYTVAETCIGLEQSLQAIEGVQQNRVASTK